MKGWEEAGMVEGVVLFHMWQITNIVLIEKKEQVETEGLNNQEAKGVRNGERS